MSALVVEASCGPGSVRRQAFEAGELTRLEEIKSQMARAFNLECDSFRIAYRDDDGDEVFLSTRQDLSDAIEFFRYERDSPSASAITLRVHLLLDCGPRLSERGSSTGRTSESDKDGDKHLDPQRPYDQYSADVSRRLSSLRSESGQHHVVRGNARRTLSDDDKSTRTASSDAFDGLVPVVDTRPASTSRPASNPRSNETDRERLWMQAQEERLSHFARNKAHVQQRPSGNVRQAEGRPNRTDSLPTPSRATQILTSTSHVHDDADQLPNFLVELRLSRQNVPSILSSIPDQLLRCCACDKTLVGFRYVCCVCGPILPTSNLSDDGSGSSEEAGFELCPTCVETAGVKHAQDAVEAVQRRRARHDSGESQVELRHAFVELCAGGTAQNGAVSQPQGWKEVDYDDDVHCTICKKGPVQRNRFKCLSCRSFELCLACYRSVEEIHPAHSFLSIPDRPAPPTVSVPAPGAMSTAHSNGHGISHAVRHDVTCSSCLQRIVGTRYSCSQCSCELCEECESCDNSDDAGDKHPPDHILLKIKTLVSSAAVEYARARARDVASPWNCWHSPSQDLRPGEISPTLHNDTPQYPLRSLPPIPALQPPLGTHTSPHPDHQIPSISPPPPPIYDLDARERTPVIDHGNWIQPDGRTPTSGSHTYHGVKCQHCSREIIGVRWMCATCGSAPTFDLCSTCERFASGVHDPLHSFLRLVLPLRMTLPPLSHFLPILYDPSSPLTLQDDAQAGHEQVTVHQQVVCDVCLEAIVGPWMRCCHCPTSFDLCGECLSRTHHDEAHVFLKLTRKVDLPLFREITQLSSPDPQPLLAYSIYA